MRRDPSISERRRCCSGVSFAMASPFLSNLRMASTPGCLTGFARLGPMARLDVACLLERQLLGSAALLGIERLEEKADMITEVDLF